MEQAPSKKRPGDDSMPSTATTNKKVKHATTTSSHTRDMLEAMYDLQLQPACNAFWAGRVFPSTGAKDRAQRRLLPPMGMSMFGEPSIEWISPDVVTPDVCQWLRFVITANATLITREFKEENTIRHLLKDDIDMKLQLSKGAVSMSVDATTFFRVGSMRYGSWTLYGYLLQFLHSYGYNTDRYGTQRSHILTFVTSKLPLLRMQYVMDHTPNHDDGGALQMELCKTVNDSLTIFGLVRDALYGRDGHVCNVPANSDAGKMALSVGRNCGQKLRQLIKHNDTIRTRVLGDIHKDNADYFHGIGITGSVVTMQLLFNAFDVDMRVCDIDEYNILYETNHRNNTIRRGMNVVNVDMKNIERMFDHFVERVYGKNGKLNDPQVFHHNVAAACCLLSLCYGGRSMGVLASDEISPMQLNLLDDIDDDERDNIKTLISMCTIDNMVVVRSTCKDPSLRSTVDVGNVHIDNTTVIPRIILWDMLFESYKRVCNVSSVSCDARFAFFKLLEVTRDWLYEYFRLKRDDIDWLAYPLYIDGIRLNIRMVTRTTQQTSDIRQPISDIYEMMKVECANCVNTHTTVPSTGTHVLRRFYVSIAYALYAQGNTTMGAFIRVNLGHRSGDSTHSYDHIRVTGECNRIVHTTRDTSYVSTAVFDMTVAGLMATILEMKGDMAKMAKLLANSDELFDCRLKHLEERVSELEADVSNVQHSNFLMHDHVDTLNRLEWRVEDLEAKK